MTCFKDDTIFAWDTDTMTHQFELNAGKPNSSESVSYYPLLIVVKQQLIPYVIIDNHHHTYYYKV